MHILLLGAATERLLPTLKLLGDVGNITTDVLGVGVSDHFEWMISFGYRHKVRAPILKRFGNRAINLHTSYLPWNRGAHPNFWSWIDQTPKGVTLHVMDEGIDTGPIIAQQEVALSGGSTFAETYDGLMDAAVALFDQWWRHIRDGAFETSAQNPDGGTTHFARELRGELLPRGWNTIIADALALHQK